MLMLQPLKEWQEHVIQLTHTNEIIKTKQFREQTISTYALKSIDKFARLVFV